MRLHLIPCLLLAACASPRGEHVLSLYSGKAWNEASDLHLRQSGGTDLELHGVEWHDESFEEPQYYGFRYTRWFPKAGAADGDEARLGRWGLAVDFTHAKAIADASQVVRQSGSKNGVPINGSFPISANIQRFDLSHGHNLLTLNVMHRLFPAGGRERTFIGRLQPYAGAGAGVALPHVEASIDGIETAEFQFAGWTVQGLAGVHFDLTRLLGAFVEYKLNYAEVDAELEGGESIEADILTHQAIFGLSVRF